MLFKMFLVLLSFQVLGCKYNYLLPQEGRTQGNKEDIFHTNLRWWFWILCQQQIFENGRKIWNINLEKFYNTKKNLLKNLRINYINCQQVRHVQYHKIILRHVLFHYFIIYKEL